MSGRILYTLPTGKIAAKKDTPASRVEGAKDLKFKGQETHRKIDDEYDPLLKDQVLSDLVAEFADQHIDIGKTMGIRRVELYTWCVWRKGANYVLFEQLDHRQDRPPPAPPYGDTPPLFSINSVGDTWDRGPMYQAAVALASKLGGKTTQEISTTSKELDNKQFLLLALNLKSPMAAILAERKSSSDVLPIKWEFATEQQRKQDDRYKKVDIGKVAYQIDNKSYWMLTGYKGKPPPRDQLKVTPIWQSDIPGQINEGIVSQRIVLFPLPSGIEGDNAAWINPYINYFPYAIEPGKEPPKPPNWPEDLTWPPMGPIYSDPKDHRMLTSIVGAAGWWQKLPQWESKLFPLQKVKPPTPPTPGAMDDPPPPAPPPPPKKVERYGGGVYESPWALFAPPRNGLGIYESEDALHSAWAKFTYKDLGKRAWVIKATGDTHKTGWLYTLMKVANKPEPPPPGGGPPPPPPDVPKEERFHILPNWGLEHRWTPQMMIAGAVPPELIKYHPFKIYYYPHGGNQSPGDPPDPDYFYGGPKNPLISCRYKVWPWEEMQFWADARFHEDDKPEPPTPPTPP